MHSDPWSHTPRWSEDLQDLFFHGSLCDRSGNLAARKRFSFHHIRKGECSGVLASGARTLDARPPCWIGIVRTLSGPIPKYRSGPIRCGYPLILAASWCSLLPGREDPAGGDTQDTTLWTGSSPRSIQPGGLLVRRSNPQMIPFGVSI